ncbi:MAG: hypothetical protein SGPRY_004589 [Prymnesium sp.]
MSHGETVGMEDGGGVLVLLCGLPAAGKSGFASRLVGEAEGLALLLRRPRISLFHLSFDDVLRKLSEERGVERFEPSLWHEARELILGATRAHFDRTPHTIAPPSSRTLAELGVCRTVCDDACGERSFDVVLLDDNMQYRSMRRQFYQVARATGLGLCTICFPIDPEQAVVRDDKRQGAARVGASTIRLMARTLEWPRPEQFQWERHCAILSDPRVCAPRVLQSLARGSSKQVES